MPYKIVFCDAPTTEIRAAIARPLISYNESHVGPSDHSQLVIQIEDGDGKVVGGLWGYTRAGWLYTELLAAPSGNCNLGFGRLMMEKAEHEARRRGCIGAWVDTHSFQAPEFYEKLGYKVFGELDNFPPGHRRIFFYKYL